MRERTQSERVFVQIGRFGDQAGDEVSAPHVMSEVTEILVAEWVIPHVLDQGTAVGKSVCFPQIIGGGAGESLDEQGLNVIDPEEIDHFFVSQNRISFTEMSPADAKGQKR